MTSLVLGRQNTAGLRQSALMVRVDSNISLVEFCSIQCNLVATADIVRKLWTTLACLLDDNTGVKQSSSRDFTAVFAKLIWVRLQLSSGSIFTGMNSTNGTANVTTHRFTIV